MIEDCVRLTVIRSAIEFQLRETEHRLISFKNNKYLPISNHVNQTSQKKDNFLIRYLVPDTNLWIEKMNDIKKVSIYFFCFLGQNQNQTRSTRYSDLLFPVW